MPCANTTRKRTDWRTMRWTKVWGEAWRRAATPVAIQQQEFEGVVRGGKVELIGGGLPEGARVQVRVKK